jgi:hypothetical protein
MIISIIPFPRVLRASLSLVKPRRASVLVFHALTAEDRATDFEKRLPELCERYCLRHRKLVDVFEDRRAAAA